MSAWLELVDAVFDYAVWLVTATTVGLAEAARRIWTKTERNSKDVSTLENDLVTVEQKVEKVDDRVDDLEENVDRQRRYLLGDEDDPSQPGVLEELHDVKGDINRLDSKIEENHRDVSEKLDQITDSLDGEEE